MPATLPTVHGTGVALYPIPRGNHIGSRVQKYLNGSETRFVTASPLAQFELAYSGLFKAERDALKNFYATTKGGFDNTWSFTLATQTYVSLVFGEDSFSSVESSRPNLYNVNLKFRQTIPGGAVTGAGTTFPVLSTGAACQRPYTQIVRYRTSSSDNPNGPTYKFAWYGAGLTGFPNGGVNRSGGTDVNVPGLMSWNLVYPAITDADMATLEAHFVQMNGSWQTFSFADPDSGTTFSRVRYGMQLIEYRYVQKNQASTTIVLEETN